MTAPSTREWNAPRLESPGRPDARPTRARVLLAFTAVYIIWGSTYLAIRYAVAAIPPFLMSGARFLVSGLLLFTWARLRGAATPRPAQWRDAAIAGILMLCCGNGAVSWAEQRVPSGLAALLVAVVPVWMVLIDWLRPGGKRPRAAVLTGIVLGFVGLIILVGGGSSAGAADADLSAALILIVASAAWAAGSIFNRVADRPESAALSTGIQMLGGSLGLIVVGLARGELAQVHLSQVTIPAWAGWIYLVTFGSLIGFTAYIFLLKAVSPAKASTYAYVNPLVAVFLGWAIAGESVTGRTLGAAAVILAGVAMISAAA